MSNNTTPEGAHQPLDDGGIDADGIPGGAEVTGGMPTPPELVLTHSSSVCKKVYVDSGNDNIRRWSLLSMSLYVYFFVRNDTYIATTYIYML